MQENRQELLHQLASKISRFSYYCVKFPEAIRVIGPTLCQCVKASLDNRIIICAIDEATLLAWPGGDCIQGRILSPLLRVNLVDELLGELTGNGFYSLGYADDLATVVKGKYAELISERMKTAINTVNNWCNQEELSLKTIKNCHFYKKEKAKGTESREASGAGIFRIRPKIEINISL